MKTLTVQGARIPALGLGTWKLTGRECTQRVADAIGIGYRHIDTAEVYENHEAVGQGMRASRVDRSEIFLVTKLWTEHLRRSAVHAAAERSLEQLGTDYVDLLLVHWPNEDVDLPETLEAMLELREKGRIRHLGVSNFPPSWLESAAREAPLVCDQVEYHPLLSQDHLLAPLRARDMALIAYSPLAHGKVLREPALQTIARAHDRSPTQIALRWLVAQENVGAIPKASSREHLEENFRVFDFELADPERRRLDELARRSGERTVDPDHAPRWER